MNRRAFIQFSVAASIIAGTGRSSANSAAPPSEAPKSFSDDRKHKIGPLGLQLYTVRDAMKSDFAGTLAKVAAIGYRQVEFAGYFDRDPSEIRALLDKNHLVAPSAHVDYAVVENKWQQTLDAAHAIGHSYIVCPWIEESQRQQPDGWKRAAELFNRAGEASRKANIQFAYHNHNFEFAPSPTLGGKLPYDFLLAETDANLVAMEMDLCWISVGGRDPVEYFEKYPGRFPLVHVKDWKGHGGNIDDAKEKMSAVGQGDIDWTRIFAKSGKAGIKHYFVENDEPSSPFDNIRQSFTYLSQLRF
jgi:sugar phosphate isomerase/epimerase